MSKKDNTNAPTSTAADAVPDESTVIVPRSLLMDIYTVLDRALAITDTAMGQRLAYIRNEVDPVKRRVLELVVQ